MPKSGRKAKSMTASRGPSTQDHYLSRKMDELAEFEEFRESILPALRRDLKSGMTTEEMRNKWAPIIQARLITTALLAEKSADSNAAARDILDRQEGKAKDRSEHVHRFENMEEAQVDAVMLAKLSELKSDDDEDTTPKH